jgi:hypothetical protein
MKVVLSEATADNCLRVQRDPPRRKKVTPNATVFLTRYPAVMSHQELP